MVEHLLAELHLPSTTKTECDPHYKCKKCGGSTEPSVIATSYIVRISHHAEYCEHGIEPQARRMAVADSGGAPPPECHWAVCRLPVKGDRGILPRFRGPIADSES